MGEPHPATASDPSTEAVVTRKLLSALVARPTGGSCLTCGFASFFGSQLRRASLPAHEPALASERAGRRVLALVGIGDSGASPVASSTMEAASSFTSRGRLRERSGISARWQIG
jgi:hypothetical protein